VAVKRKDGSGEAMNFREAEEYLDRRGLFAIKPSLDRISVLCHGGQVAP
jgi:hypothetical protein